jgi:signal transduction histidine kinase
MAAGTVGKPANDRSRLAVRIHDVSAGLAVGIGLLKGLKHSAASGGSSDCDGPIEVFEAVLADLRQLAPEPNRTTVMRPRMELAELLTEEARRIGVAVDLEVRGHDDWLDSDQAELLRHAAREAIRNVKRHSGADRCRMTIDLCSCPFILQVRDWGAGISGQARVGNGIEGLRELAWTMGCDLTIRSHPGLGTELVLRGRLCPLNAKSAIGHEASEAPLRSVVAEESLGTRRRVAARRPITASGQQIT